jgi:hypothetical protein
MQVVAVSLAHRHHAVVELPGFIMLRLAVAVAVAIALPAPAEARRVALVIGQNAYTHATLPALANPRNDARRIAELLGKNGFELISCRSTPDPSPQGGGEK